MNERDSSTPSDAPRPPGEPEPEKRERKFVELGFDHCPHCGEVATKATSMHGEPDFIPQPGDPNMCCTCTGLSVFNEEMKLRIMTAEEWAACPPLQSILIEEGRAHILSRRKALGLKFHPQKPLP
jgi:hypothetical protein